MVMAEQEENVQTVSGSLIQHIKQVVGIFAVTGAVGTHAVVQLDMGHNENRLGISRTALCIQIGTQVGSGGLNGGLRVVIPVIILFVDGKHTVGFRLMSATGDQCAIGGFLIHVMVALKEKLMIVAEGGKLLVDHILQVRHTLLGGGSGKGLRIVAAEQQTVIALKALVFNGCQNIPHMTAGNAVVRIGILEVGACDHGVGLSFRCSRIGSHCGNERQHHGKTQHHRQNPLGHTCKVSFHKCLLLTVFEISHKVFCENCIISNTN